MRSFIRNSIRGFILLVSMSLALPVCADKPVYKLAIVPQYSPLFIFRNWRPLVERLEQEMDCKLEILTYKDFKQFNKSLQNGEPDFTYLSPYHLVLARRHQPYVPLLRDEARELVGIIVVPKSSKINDIEELQGQTLAFPSPNAFAASLYMRAWLREKVGLEFTPSYVGTHGNVYRNVVHRVVPAGGGVNSTFYSQPRSLQDALRILYKIPGVAAHPLAVHERVPVVVRERFVETMLSLMEDKEGSELLAAIQVNKPVLADYARDYEYLEHMKLDKYKGNQE